MIHRCLFACLLMLATMAASRAKDKPKLPEGAPPRFASVVQVKGDVIVYRDFYLMPPIPKKGGQLNPKELVPSNPASGAMFACAVEFSLKKGEVFDAGGKKLDAEAAKKRLAVGDTVLVSTGGMRVDPTYLRIVKKETLIFVHPAPAPVALPKP